MPTPPTPAQLRYLRRLAERTGTTFTPPRSIRDASRQIETLKSRPASRPYDLDADERALEQRHGTHTGISECSRPRRSQSRSASSRVTHSA
jgi:hypothetical protein